MVDGQDTCKEETKAHRLVISKDGKIAMFDGPNQMADGKILSVDVSQKTNTIDFTLAGRSEFDGRYVPQVPLKGIYEADKQSFKICQTRTEAAPRPTTVASPKGMNVVLLHCERLQ